MQAEVLTHFPHAESPRCIGCPNRVIPLRVLLSVPSHRPGAARPLAARHFTQVLAWLELGNGSVNKGLRVDQSQRNLCTEQDLTPLLWNKTSYLDSADVQTDTFSDETAGPGEADKTLGEAACGSDKSPGPSVCSSQSER